jgi:excinuclease ABC subunit B
LIERIETAIYPAKHFVTSAEKLQSAIRTSRTRVVERVAELEGEGKIPRGGPPQAADLVRPEMLQETGYCSGRRELLDAPVATPVRRAAVDADDYFADDFLVFVDESHISLHRSVHVRRRPRRKDVLIDFGFRCPSARREPAAAVRRVRVDDHQAIYVSATPGPYEHEHSTRVVQQVIRRPALIDPPVSVRPTKGQIDDLLHEVNTRVARGERALVTTLTKRMAEDLADYLKEMGVRTHYLHSEIDTMERIEILRDLRLGIYDVVVGINLLREGLDLPEVSLVCILDADKEGFLRSEGSLVQTIGRAARHVDGQVIMYADTMTRSMKAAIDETYRRRAIQIAHNEAHGIEPRGIVKQIKDLTDRVRVAAEEAGTYDASAPSRAGIIAQVPRDEVVRLIKDLESQMKGAAKNLEFERAALLRDQSSSCGGWSRATRSPGPSTSSRQEHRVDSPSST